MGVHARSADFFKGHPTVNEFWFTSDGQHFKTEAKADATAQKLKALKQDDTVTLVTREEWENWKPEEVKGEKTFSFEHVVTQQDIDNNPDAGLVLDATIVLTVTAFESKKAVAADIDPEKKKALTVAKTKVTKLQKVYDQAAAGTDQNLIDGAKMALDQAKGELEALMG